MNRYDATETNDRRAIRQSAGAALLTMALAICCFVCSGCAGGRGESFTSPEDAATALATAMNPFDEARLVKILGPGSEDVISSGDPVADKAAGERFAKAYAAKHGTGTNDDGSVTLFVGDNDWPFPIPLVGAGNSWSFDTEKGRQELIDRRIGRNELSTIDVCRAIVDAQREYFDMDPDGDGVHEYAAKFRSTPGKRDGLYWKQVEGQPPSPLGELAAEASAEGYTAGKADERRPYHGYYFRLVTGQGPDAPGGERNYMVDGQLTGGFGVVAWPASYGNSGIMTFMVGENGVVFQKDLGDDTERSAEFIDLFEPGPGWDVVE